jgi:outer membrane protein insertion porin family
MQTLRKLIVILVFHAGIYVVPVSAQTEFQVEGINVVTDQDADRLKIIELLGFKKGDVFRPSRLADSLSRIAETGRYETVRGEFNAQTKILSVHVRSSVVLSQVEVNLASTQQLERTDLDELKVDLLGVTGIAQGDVIYLDVVADVRNRIRKRLFDRGFENPRVVVSVEEKSVPQRRMIVSVNLGKRSQINRIVFKNFSSEDVSELTKALRAQFESRGYVDDFDFARNFVAGLLLNPTNLLKDVSESKSADTPPLELKKPLPMDWVTISETISALSRKSRSLKFYDFQLKAKPISISSGEYLLEFDLSRGKQYRIDVNGTTLFWERDIKNRLLDKPQRLGIPFSIAESEKLIRRLYREKGFVNVEVSVEESESAFIRYVRFQVKEGTQYFIGDISLEGTDVFSEISVRQAIDKWLKPTSDAFGKTYLDEELLRSRLPELVAELRERGYLQARVLDLRISKPTQNQRVGIEISVQVGSLFRFREIEVEGDVTLGKNRLDELVDIEPGEVVNPNAVLRVSRRLIQDYQRLGFLNVSVPTQEKELFGVDLENNLVDVTFKISPGPKVRVGQIFVQGYKKTNPEVVERELRKNEISEKAAWNPEGLAKAEQGLSSLGIFGNVRFEPVGGRILSQGFAEFQTVPLQEKDIRVVVTESAPGSIEFGPGFRTDLGLVGFAELNYRNLSGLNRGVNLRAQVSRKIANFQFLEQKYSAVFLEPYFFDWDLRFRTTLAFIKEDQIQFVDGQPVSGFNSDEVSFGFAFEKQISESMRFTHRLYEISRPRIYDIVNRDTFETDREIYRIGSFGTSVYYDTRNNFFNPSKGWYLSSSYDFAPRFLGTDSDASFLLLKQVVNRYFSVGNEGAVFALSLSYSHIFGLGDTGGIPENKRLVLGGRTSIRSLAEQFVRFDGEGLIEQNSYEFKVEFRQPVVLDFGMAFFADLGELRAIKFLDNSPSQRSGMQVGIGFGVRYTTAVGPLALDFAINPDANGELDPFRIQFSIGSF